VVLAVLTGLSGCGPGRNQFAPACPEAHLLPQAADFARYRNEAGHDLTDMVLSGRVLKVDGHCEPGSGPNKLDASVTVTLEFNRGPAASGRQADVQYFVAVAEGDQILDKKILRDRVTFPSNLDRLFLVSDPVDMQLPVSPEKTGAAYTVWVGFQLTPAEMAASNKP
jgi:hypothetical protein